MLLDRHLYNLKKIDYNIILFITISNDLCIPTIKSNITITTIYNITLESISYCSFKWWKI